jgi:hypothetical protein
MKTILNMLLITVICLCFYPQILLGQTSESFEAVLRNVSSDPKDVRFRMKSEVKGQGFAIKNDGKRLKHQPKGDGTSEVVIHLVPGEHVLLKACNPKLDVKFTVEMSITQDGKTYDNVFYHVFNPKSNAKNYYFAIQAYSDCLTVFQVPDISKSAQNSEHYYSKFYFNMPDAEEMLSNSPS